MQTSQVLSAEQLVQFVISQATQLALSVEGTRPKELLQVPQVLALMQMEQLTTLQTKQVLVVVFRVKPELH